MSEASNRSSITGNSNRYDHHILFLVFIIPTASPRKPEKEYCSSGLVKENNGPFQLESQQFTYKDLISITKDFEHAIGKGGFGTVYYGELGDGTQVAVKLRSQSSQQGTKEFQAEARKSFLVFLLRKEIPF